MWRLYLLSIYKKSEACRHNRVFMREWSDLVTCEYRYCDNFYLNQTRCLHYACVMIRFQLKYLYCWKTVTNVLFRSLTNCWPAVLNASSLWFRLESNNSIFIRHVLGGENLHGRQLNLFFFFLFSQQTNKEFAAF